MLIGLSFSSWKEESEGRKAMFSTRGSDTHTFGNDASDLSGTTKNQVVVRKDRFGLAWR